MLDVGERCMVQREDNQWYPAEIIKPRDGENGNTIYYVHYQGFDRRLDEWVPENRVTSYTVSVVSSSIVAPAIDNTTRPVVGRRAIRVASGPKTPEGPGQTSIPTGSAGAAVSEDDTPTRKMTRSQKRMYDEINHVVQSIEDMNETTAELERQREELTKIKYIILIQMGAFEMVPWYYSPYPDEYEKVSRLWICEFCLKYMRLETTFRNHMPTCKHRQPPGIEIYRKGIHSIYEIDGKKHKLYCQNLCLLSKLFLDHKTLFYDVEPFMFYVLCEIQKYGAQMVGYFSKEKQSSDGYNLSCILTLPPHQKVGYGKLMIAFSYELSKLENTIGSPEKPLSDLGKVSYRSYWKWTLLETLHNHRGINTLQELSALTSILEADIVSTLRPLNLVRFWKSLPVLSASHKLVEELFKENKKPLFTIDPSCINWKWRPGQKAAKK